MTQSNGDRTRAAFVSLKIFRGLSEPAGSWCFGLAWVRVLKLYIRAPGLGLRALKLWNRSSIQAP